MTRLRILAACALLVLGACKDSTGSQPKPELTVQVTATASPPTFREGADGEQQIECSITFVATVAGNASVKGRWTGGVLRFFIGTSTTAADSLVMTDFEMSQAFGGDFAAGEERAAGLGLLAYAPFALEIEMGYRWTASTRPSRPGRAPPAAFPWASRARSPWSPASAWSPPSATPNPATPCGSPGWPAARRGCGIRGWK